MMDSSVVMVPRLWRNKCCQKQLPRGFDCKWFVGGLIQ